MASNPQHEQLLRQKSEELADAVLQGRGPEDILKITEELYQSGIDFEADLAHLYQLRDEAIARRQQDASQALIDRSRQEVDALYQHSRLRPKYRDALGALQQGGKKKKGFAKIKQTWQAIGVARKGFTKTEIDAIEQEYAQRQERIAALEARQGTLVQAQLNSFSILNTSFSQLSQATAATSQSHQQSMLQQGLTELAQINAEIEAEKRALAQLESHHQVISRFTARVASTPERQFQEQVLDVYGQKMKERDQILTETSDIRLQLHDLLQRNQIDHVQQNSIEAQIIANQAQIAALNAELTNLENHGQQFIAQNQDLAYSRLFAQQQPQTAPSQNQNPITPPPIPPLPLTQPTQPTLSRSQSISSLQIAAGIPQRANAEAIFNHLEQSNLPFNFQQYFQPQYHKIWQFMSAGRLNGAAIISDLSKTYPHTPDQFLAVFQTNNFEEKFNELITGNNLQDHIQSYIQSNPAQPTSFDLHGLQHFLDDSNFLEITNRHYLQPLRSFGFTDHQIHQFINANSQHLNILPWDLISEPAFQSLISFFNNGGQFQNQEIISHGYRLNPANTNTIIDLFNLIYSLEQVTNNNLEQVFSQIYRPVDLQQKWDQYIQNIGPNNFGLSDASLEKFIQFIYAGAPTAPAATTSLAATPLAAITTILSQQNIAVDPTALINAVTNYLQTTAPNTPIEWNNLNTNLDLFFNHTGFDQFRQQWKADSPAQIALLLDPQNTAALQLLSQPNFDQNAFQQFINSHYQPASLPLSPPQFITELRGYEQDFTAALQIANQANATPVPATPTLAEAAQKQLDQLQFHQQKLAQYGFSQSAIDAYLNSRTDFSDTEDLIANSDYDDLIHFIVTGGTTISAHSFSPIGLKSAGPQALVDLLADYRITSLHLILSQGNSLNNAWKKYIEDEIGIGSVTPHDLQIRNFCEYLAEKRGVERGALLTLQQQSIENLLQKYNITADVTAIVTNTERFNSLNPISLHWDNLGFNLDVFFDSTQLTDLRQPINIIAPAQFIGLLDPNLSETLTWIGTTHFDLPAFEAYLTPEKNRLGRPLHFSEFLAQLKNFHIDHTQKLTTLQSVLGTELGFSAPAVESFFNTHSHYPNFLQFQADISKPEYQPMLKFFINGQSEISNPPQPNVLRDPAALFDILTTYKPDSLHQFLGRPGQRSRYWDAFCFHLQTQNTPSPFDYEIDSFLLYLHQEKQLQTTISTSLDPQTTIGVLLAEYDPAATIDAQNFQTELEAKAKDLSIDQPRWANLSANLDFFIATDDPKINQLRLPINVNNPKQVAALLDPQLQPIIAELSNRSFDHQDFTTFITANNGPGALPLSPQKFVQAVLQYKEQIIDYQLELKVFEPLMPDSQYPLITKAIYPKLSKAEFQQKQATIRFIFELSPLVGTTIDIENPADWLLIINNYTALNNLKQTYEQLTDDDQYIQALFLSMTQGQPTSSSFIKLLVTEGENFINQLQQNDHFLRDLGFPVQDCQEFVSSQAFVADAFKKLTAARQQQDHVNLLKFLVEGGDYGGLDTQKTSAPSALKTFGLQGIIKLIEILDQYPIANIYHLIGGNKMSQRWQEYASHHGNNFPVSEWAIAKFLDYLVDNHGLSNTKIENPENNPVAAVDQFINQYGLRPAVPSSLIVQAVQAESQKHSPPRLLDWSRLAPNRDFRILLQPIFPFAHQPLNIENPAEFIHLLTDDPILDQLLNYIETTNDNLTLVARYVTQKTNGTKIDAREFISLLKKYQTEVIAYAEELSNFVGNITGAPVAGTRLHEIIVNGFIPRSEFLRHQAAFEFAFTIETASGRIDVTKIDSWETLYQNIIAIGQVEQAVNIPGRKYISEALQGYCQNLQSPTEAFNFLIAPQAIDFIQKLETVTQKLISLGFANQSAVEAFIQRSAASSYGYQTLTNFHQAIEESQIQWFLKFLIKGHQPHPQKKGRKQQKVNFGAIAPVHLQDPAELMTIYRLLETGGHSFVGCTRLLRDPQSISESWRNYITEENVDPADVHAQKWNAFFIHLSTNPELAILSTEPQVYLQNFLNQHGDPSTDTAQLFSEVTALLNQRGNTKPNWSNLAKTSALKLFFDQTPVSSQISPTIRQRWSTDSAADIHQIIDPGLGKALDSLNNVDFSSQLESFISQKYSGQLPLDPEQFKAAVIRFDHEIISYLPTISDFIQTLGATPTVANTCSIAVTINDRIPSANFAQNQELFTFAFNLSKVAAADPNDLSQWHQISQQLPQLSRFKRSYEAIVNSQDFGYLNLVFQSRLALCNDGDEVIDFLVNQAQDYIESLRDSHQALNDIGYTPDQISEFIEKNPSPDALNHLQINLANQNQYKNFLKTLVTGNQFANITVNGIAPLAIGAQGPEYLFGNILKTYPIDELQQHLSGPSDFERQWRAYITGSPPPTDGNLPNFFEYLTGNSVALNSINDFCTQYSAALDPQQILTALKQLNPNALPWDLLQQPEMAVYFQSGGQLTGIRSPLPISDPQIAANSINSLLTDPQTRQHLDYFKAHGSPLDSLANFYDSQPNNLRQMAATPQEFQDFLVRYFDQVGGYAQKIETFIDHKTPGNILLSAASDIAVNIYQRLSSSDFDQYQDSLEFIFSVSSISSHHLINWEQICGKIPDFKTHFDTLTPDENYLRNLWHQKAESQPSATEAISFLLESSATFLQEMREYRQQLQVPLSALGYDHHQITTFISENSLDQTAFPLELFDPTALHHHLLKFFVDGQQYGSNTVDLGSEKFIPLKDSSPQELFNLIKDFNVIGLQKHLSANQTIDKTFTAEWKDYVARHQPFNQSIDAKLSNFLAELTADIDLNQLAKGPTEFTTELFEYFGQPDAIPTDFIIKTATAASQPNWPSLANKARLKFFFDNPNLDSIREPWTLTDPNHLAQLIDETNQSTLEYLSDPKLFDLDLFIKFSTNSGNGIIQPGDLMAAIKNYQQTLESYTTRLNRFIDKTMSRPALPEATLHQIVVAINHNINESQFDNHHLQTFEFLFNLQGTSQTPLLQLDDIADWQALADKQSAFAKFSKLHDKLFKDPDHGYQLEVLADHCAQFSHSNQLLDFILSDQSIEYLKQLSQFTKTATQALNQVQSQIKDKIDIPRQAKEIVKRFHSLELSEFKNAMAAIKTIFSFEVTFLSSANKRYLDFYDDEVWSTITTQAPIFDTVSFKANKSEIQKYVAGLHFNNDQEFVEQLLTQIIPNIEKLKGLQGPMTERDFVRIATESFGISNPGAADLFERITSEFGKFTQQQFFNTHGILAILQKISPSFSDRPAAWHHVLSSQVGIDRLQVVHRSAERQAALIRTMRQPEIYANYDLLDQADIMLALSRDPQKLFASLKEKNPTTNQFEVPLDFITEIAESLHFLNRRPNTAASGYPMMEFLQEFYPGQETLIERIAMRAGRLKALADLKIRDLKNIHPTAQILNLIRPDLLSSLETWNGLITNSQILRSVAEICPDDLQKQNLATFLRDLQFDGQAFIEIIAALTTHPQESRQALSASPFLIDPLQDLLTANLINQKRQETFSRFTHLSVFSKLGGIGRKLKNIFINTEKKIAQIFPQLDAKGLDFNKLYRYPQVVDFMFFPKAPLLANTSWNPEQTAHWEEMLSWEESKFQLLANMIDQQKIELAASAMAATDRFHPLPSSTHLAQWIFDHPDWEIKLIQTQ